jgi:hypothetical protein
VGEKKAPEPPIMSLTQVGINDLKDQIGELKGLMNRKKKVLAMFPNQAAIKLLQDQVKKLKDELEHKGLYCGSLENDFFSPQKSTRDDDFHEMAYKNRQLERENCELFKMINRDKMRDPCNRYRDY